MTNAHISIYPLQIYFECMMWQKKGGEAILNRETNFPFLSIWSGRIFSLETHRRQWKCFTCSRAFSKDCKISLRLAVVQLVKRWGKEAFSRRKAYSYLWATERDTWVDVRVAWEEAIDLSFLTTPLTKRITWSIRDLGRLRGTNHHLS